MKPTTVQNKYRFQNILGWFCTENPLSISFSKWCYSNIRIRVKKHTYITFRKNNLLYNLFDFLQCRYCTSWGANTSTFMSHTDGMASWWGVQWVVKPTVQISGDLLWGSLYSNLGFLFCIQICYCLYTCFGFAPVWMELGLKDPHHARSPFWPHGVNIECWSFCFS